MLAIELYSDEACDLGWDDENDVFSMVFFNLNLRFIYYRS